jgi:hypothetical protein
MGWWDPPGNWSYPHLFEGKKNEEREQMIYIMHTSQPTENCIASHKVLIKRESKENNPRARRGLW